MARKTTGKKLRSSRVVWTHLESMVRVNVRGFIQGLLEEEVEDFLGRARYVRKSAGDPEPGYRNGHGRPRKLTLSCGTVEVRRPRVRDMDERFESAILPFLVRRTREVDALIPELYLHGLAAGDMDLALRGLLGNDAPISATTVARLKERWRLEYDQWSSRSLAGLEVVALWVDGVYVKAGLEKDKAAILVAMAGLSDGRKVIVGMVSGYRESTDSWRELLCDLKERGMNAPKVVIGDGHLGIWGALRGVYPESAWQRCRRSGSSEGSACSNERGWNHKIRNVLDKLPKRSWDEAKKMLSAMSRADTEAAALELRAEFQGWCRERGHGDAADLIEKDWETLVAFYRFPKDHWRHLRTSNPIESPFDRVRLRTNAARRFKKVANATAVVWKTLMVAERRFRKLTAPELWAEVFKGATFRDGVREETPQGEGSKEAPAA